MEDWQVMREVIAAVRQAIPDASSKPPREVLELCAQPAGRYVMISNVPPFVPHCLSE
jgi:hypothetical protein